MAITNMSSEDKAKLRRIQKTQTMRRLRSQPDFRAREQAADTLRKKMISMSQGNVQVPLSQVSKIRFNSTRQGEAEDNNNDNNNKKSRCKNASTSSLEALINEYERAIQEGPTYVCVCCGLLFFKEGLHRISMDRIKEDIINLIVFLKELPIHYLCVTCGRYAYKGEIPKLALSNGFEFPDIPDELLDLTRLEERLVCPRIPFLRIMKLYPQKGLKGNIVNVAISINNMVAKLPRQFSDTYVIQLDLKRRINDKNSYMYECIRPKAILLALKYLLFQPLYLQEEITLDHGWFEDKRKDYVEFIVDHNNNNNIEDVDEDEESVDSGENNIAEIDEEEPINPGVDETLLLDQNEIFNIKIAPGEGNRPLGILYDSKAEVLAFPKIYCGQDRKLSTKLTYGAIAKSELKRYDRRCAMNTAKILYSYKKLQIHQLTNAISIVLRKKPSMSGICVGDLLEPGALESIISKDNGYGIFKQIRGAPAYWETKKKEVKAMIRQLGCPTFFMTLSAAETKWNELIVILMKTLKKKEISLEEADNLQYHEKAELIGKDPVTCARYFEYRVNKLFHCYILQPQGPFGSNNVLDYYYRVEFQHRGSPHLHIMFWLDNAPLYTGSQENEKRCVEFIDEHICCKKENVDVDVNLQRHDHSFTCWKGKNKSECRFNIPYPILKNTMILHPLEVEDLRQHKKNFMSIKEELKKFYKSNEKVSYELFLEKILKMDEETYLNAIRSSLTRPTVFLKRNSDEIFINAYNQKILKLHRANMDIQYILDPYACTAYMINYINKSNRGMSELIRKAIADCSEGNMSSRQKLSKIGSCFLNSTEVSAQEAVYMILSMPVSMSTRSHIQIPTFPSAERTRMLRPMKQLQELKNKNNKSTDIYLRGLLEHYVLRNAALEATCLAVYAADYDFFPTKSKSKTLKEVNIEDIDDNQDLNKETDCFLDIEQESDKKGKLYLLDQSGYNIKRNRTKIIRSRSYKKSDEIEYYREQILLYHPWRNEHDDIENQDCKQLYLLNEENIILLRNRFNSCLDDEERLEEVMKQVEEEEEYKAKKLEVTEEEADLLLELGDCCGRDEVGRYPEVSVIDDSLYFEKVRSLNFKQKRYLIHLIHSLKNNANEPIYEFVTGGAGVGKSVLIQCIYQTVIRMYNRTPGAVINELKCLLTSYTGKAAFNIRGLTLHSAFALPVTQAGETWTELSRDVANTIAQSLKSLKILIIDEISMVGARTFNQVDKRLRQIMQKNCPFGGVSVLVFGDFRQLRPVGDTYIFTGDSSNMYHKLIGNPLWNLFKMYRLTEIMRQKDDLLFAEALNAISIGKMEAKHIELMKSRTSQFLSLDTRKKSINLFWKNEDVDAYNDMVLSKMNTEGCFSYAIDSIVNDEHVKNKTSLLNSAKNKKTIHTYGLPSQLNLKVDARYMVTINVDTLDGIVNGNTGILKKISYGSSAKTINRPTVAWLDFQDPEVGVKTRNTYIELALKAKIARNSLLTPILPQIRIFKCGKSQVKRIQFPLTPAEAITIHKSQGGSHDNVAVALKCLSRQLLYVSSSRARTSSGLALEGSFKPPDAPSKGDPVENELKRLETNAPIYWSIIFPLDVVSTELKLKVAFQKVDDLELRLNDIINDVNFMSFDILVITHYLSNKKPIEIPGFDLYNNNCNRTYVYGKVESLNELLCTESFYYNFMDFILLYNLDCVIIYMMFNESFNYDSFNRIITKKIQTIKKKYNQVAIIGQKGSLKDECIIPIDNYFLNNDMTPVIKINSGSNFFYTSSKELRFISDVYDAYFTRWDSTWCAFFNSTVDIENFKPKVYPISIIPTNLSDDKNIKKRKPEKQKQSSNKKKKVKENHNPIVITDVVCELSKRLLNEYSLIDNRETLNICFQELLD